MAHSKKVRCSPREKGEPPCGSQGGSSNSLANNHTQKRRFAPKKTSHSRAAPKYSLGPKCTFLSGPFFVASAPNFSLFDFFLFFRFFFFFSFFLFFLLFSSFFFFCFFIFPLFFFSLFSLFSFFFFRFPFLGAENMFFFWPQLLHDFL